MSTDRNVNSRTEVAAIAAVLIVFAVMVSIIARSAWSDAAAAADYSAHAALMSEIWAKLDSVPPGQAYPDSLAQLQLTYPDGGDASLLDRFEYDSMGNSCTVRTVLGGKTILRAFPSE